MRIPVIIDELVDNLRRMVFQTITEPSLLLTPVIAPTDATKKLYMEMPDAKFVHPGYTRESLDQS